MLGRRPQSAAATAPVSLAIGLSALPGGASRAETVLRIAMTAADLPDWRGQPDQGFEGYRFVGYSLYDGIVAWDLSRSDQEAGIRPGLATSWSVDPDDHKQWIFELRQGVKFHDGCDWNADSAVWNIDRMISDKNPAFTPYNFGRGRSRTSSIDHVFFNDASTTEIYTRHPESLFPFNLAYVLMLSKCAVEKAGNNLDVYA